MIEIDLRERDRVMLEALRASERGDAAAAILACDEALKDNPKRAEALFLAGIEFMRANQEGIALQLFNVASKIDPDRHAIYHNMGCCLHERHPAEAYEMLLKAQDLEPDRAETLQTLVNVASTLGRHAQAIEWGRRHQALYGFEPQTAHNLSFALFALGRWSEAWPLFRHSLGAEDRVSRNYTPGAETPRWEPNVRGGKVVVYGEQGIGDEIMYASMLSEFIKRAHANKTDVILEVDARNADLFRRSFPQVTVHGTRGRNYCDWPKLEKPTHRLEMGGLGEFFGEKPFRRGAYLKACDTKRAMWREYLNREGTRGNLKVGVAWTGGSWSTGRSRRSVDFDQFLQIMSVKGVDFVNLEYEDRRDDLEFAPHGCLNPDWATKKGACYDLMAALVSELDLVISVTTSVVDLAGALGAPVWALADEHPQWRYSDHLGADKMFFYESAKVYRQERWGHWAPTVQQVRDDLDDLANKARAAA